MFYEKEKQVTIKSKIYSISEKYNIDKKHLLQCYFNHIIRFKLVSITPEFIELLKKIVHNTNSNMEDVIHYMISHISNVQIKPAASSVANVS